MERRPQVYLSYAQSAEKEVDGIYQQLLSAGVRPWMYKYNVLPGERWEDRIEQAIHESAIFLVLLTPEWGIQGKFVHQELELALKEAEERDGGVFVIPVILKPCEVPNKLRHLRWVDLTAAGGWSDLLRAVGASATTMLERPEPPAELVQACVAGDCVLYVGSGLSVPAGLPTWRPMVGKLLDWAGREQIIGPVLMESLRQAMEFGETDLIADHVVASVHSAKREGDLIGYLAEMMSAGARPSATHEMLRRINFSAVLTTNFDNLLEQAFVSSSKDRVFVPADTEMLLESLSKRRFFVLRACYAQSAL